MVKKTPPAKNTPSDVELAQKLQINQDSEYCNSLSDEMSNAWIEYLCDDPRGKAALRSIDSITQFENGEV